MCYSRQGRLLRQREVISAGPALDSFEPYSNAPILPQNRMGTHLAAARKGSWIHATECQEWRHTCRRCRRTSVACSGAPLLCRPGRAAPPPRECFLWGARPLFHRMLSGFHEFFSARCVSNDHSPPASAVLLHGTAGAAVVNRRCFFTHSAVLLQCLIGAPPQVHRRCPTAP